MTQEEKELLLKDLCSRLPYGVKGIRVYKPEEIVVLGEIIPRCKLNPNIGAGVFCELGFDDNPDCCPIDRFKPYLRPMSSMTEDERNEYRKLCYIRKRKHYQPTGKCNDVLLYVKTKTTEERYDNAVSFDFLYSHHFDYRGLIEKGLALEAPEGMYKFE